MDTEVPSEITNSTEPVAATAVTIPAADESRPNKKPKITGLIIVAVTVLLLGTGAAAYIKIVVNSPENIWASAMKNTSEGYKQLSQLAQAEPSKGGTVEGSFSLVSPVAAEGKMTGGWYENNSQYSGEIKTLGVSAAAEVRTISQGSNTNPDMYVRIEGLEDSLPLIDSIQPGLAPVVSAINGSWFEIDSATLSDILPAESTDATNMQIQEQISDISAKLVPVLNETLFTTDISKAVAIVKNPVGREEFNGHDTYKFDVEIQSSQSADFINAVKDALKDTPLESLLERSTSSTGGDSMDIDELAPGVVESTDTYNIEAWVDMNLKYFRNVRVTPVDKDGKSRGYIEFGLDYKLGDTMPFNVGIMMTASEDSADNIKAVLSASINKSTKAVDFGFDVSGSVASQKIEASGKLSLKPSDDQLQVEKPDNAKSIIELVMQLSGGNPDDLEQSVLDSFGEDSSLLDIVEL